MLSYRLEKIAGYIHDCDVVADIGTDHAFLPIFLVENKIAKKVYAVDVNHEPLENAKKNIKNLNLQDYIETIKSDGMNYFDENDKIILDCVVIAGLGSSKILQIFKNWKNPNRKAIICSNTQPSEIRKWLMQSAYQIELEDFIIDNQKNYWIIVINFNKQNNQKIHKRDIEFGSFKFFKKNHSYLNYCLNEIKKWSKIKNDLDKLKHKNEIYDINKKVKLLEKVISEIT